jgi:hypothetical protein
VDSHCQLLGFHQLKETDITYIQFVVMGKFAPASTKLTPVVIDLEFSFP